MLSFLRDQHLFPKFYWEDREGNRIAAIGKLDEYFFDVPCSSNDRFYGGMAFLSSGEDQLWSSFPRSYFFLPAFEIREKKKSQRIIINRANVSLVSNKKEKRKKLEILKREDTPGKEEWNRQVALSLQLIDEKKIQKVILARRTSLKLSEPLSGLDILEQLRRIVSLKTVTLFGLQLRENSIFIGATPEKLYSRKEDRIISEAIAGTRQRGKTKMEDQRLKEELLQCSKDKREFDFVSEDIFKKFASFCDCFENQEPSILSTSHLFHLYQQFSGKLKEPISDQKLLLNLHPTAAIAGFPKSKAIAWIKKLEPFDRGWYSGPIGWTSKEEAEFHVGIRSALVEDREIHLFAGVGIVSGSIAEKEWEELEHKIRPFQDALESINH